MAACLSWSFLYLTARCRAQSRSEVLHQRKSQSQRSARGLIQGLHFQQSHCHCSRCALSDRDHIDRVSDAPFSLACLERHLDVPRCLAQFQKRHLEMPLR